jgi:hypothetical protein
MAEHRPIGRRGHPNKIRRSSDMASDLISIQKCSRAGRRARPATANQLPREMERANSQDLPIPSTSRLLCQNASISTKSEWSLGLRGSMVSDVHLLDIPLPISFANWASLRVSGIPTAADAGSTTVRRLTYWPLAGRMEYDIWKSPHPIFVVFSSSHHLSASPAPPCDE